MGVMKRSLVTFGVLVVLLVGLFYFTQWFSLITGYALGEDEKLKLAQCLNGKGSTLYISSTCPSCIKQINEFGDADKFLNVQECSDVSECPAIKAVPAWRINGEFYYGFHELKKLADISGCEID